MQKLQQSSVWQELKSGRITCDEALKRLVDESGLVNLDLLDPEVTQRFLRYFPERKSLPAVIPLLLWRNCYFLGSPVPLPPEAVKKLSQQTLTDIQFVPIER